MDFLNLLINLHSRTELEIELGQHVHALHQQQRAAVDLLVAEQTRLDAEPFLRQPITNIVRRPFRDVIRPTAGLDRVGAVRVTTHTHK